MLHSKERNGNLSMKRKEMYKRKLVLWYVSLVYIGVAMLIHK
jgi:hypothetical protein